MVRNCAQIMVIWIQYTERNRIDNLEKKKRLENRFQGVFFE
jgi:hypothetical protein